MKNFLLFTLSVLFLINVMGCSAVRFTETRMMEGVKKVNKTDLKLDFQLDYNPTNRSLSINLAHQPYAIYKPQITLIDLGVGLASFGILGKVFYDNWDHDYTFDFTDDTFDWYGSEWWEKAILIGVPVDMLLYWTFSYPFDRKMVKLQRQPLINQPYRIELPNHGNIGKDYTTITGTEQIDIEKFLSDIGNPSYLKDIGSFKYQVSTEVSGDKYRRYYTAPNPNPSPPNPIIKIDAEWVTNPIRAGEKAVLSITVVNTGETTLTELSATTSSSNLHFNNWELKFGNIPQGKSVTRALGFNTDPEMLSTEITVIIHFKTFNGNVDREIQKEISITR